MGWAQLIGTFIGATIIAAFASWQIWKRFLSPMLSEITGPADQPGMRTMMRGLEQGQREQARASNTIAAGVERLTGHFEDVRRDVHALKESDRDHGQRLRAVEGGLEAVKATVALEIQERRAKANGPAAPDEVPTDGGLSSSGATGPGESHPPTRAGR